MANNEVKLRLSVDGTATVVSDVDRVSDKFGTLDSRARQAAQGADTLKTALGAMATMGTVYAMVKMADAVTTLNTQLRLSSNSAAEAAKAYTSLFDIAQKGRVNFTELGTTYAAIARSGKELGISQDRLLTVTQSISQAMTIGGGSAASMQAALVQLGQGLSSGVLRGEELNSIMEQTPRLAKALADGLGVPIGELRKLGEAGKLTSEQVIGALERAGPQLAKEMESATLTVGQAMTVLSNSATKLIGEMDAASGASGTLAGALKAISGGIDAAGHSIKDNETAFKFITSGLAGAATAAGLGATAIGIGAVWAAVTLGGSAAVTAALAALGTVVGLAIAAGNELSHSEGIIKLSLAKINNEIEAAEKAKNYVLVTTLKERQALLEKELQDKQKKSTAIIGSVPSPDRAFEREAAKQDAKAQAELLSIRQKLSGVDANYLPTLERLNELRLAGTLGEKEYIALVSDLADKNYKKAASVKANTDAEKEHRERIRYGRAMAIAEGEAVENANKAYQKSLQDATKEHVSYIATLNRSADSVGVHVQKLQDEEAALRLSAAQNISLAQALELVAIGRLHEEQAKQMSYGDDAAASAIQTEIDKRRELIGLIGSKDAREANKKAVDELEKANQKAAEESEKFWTDALMRGFESGKSFFDNFWDTIKNKIKTDVLRVMVQPVAQGITGMMGLSGAANAAGTAGAASGIGTLGSVAAGVSAFGGTLATGFVNTLVGSGMSGGLTAAGAMIANGAWASGLGMAAGALGPIGLGIAALSMIGNKDKSTANTGNASARFDASGNRTDYQTYYGGSSDGVDKMLASLQTSYATTAKALGIAAAATQFSYGGNTGKNGESPNFALGGGAGSSKFYQGETASSDAAISLAASRAVFAALQGSDLPAYLAKVFNGATADALSQEQITNTLAYAASLKQVRDALLETREPLQILKDNVAQGTAALSTSAETFKTDFVAALDSGITPDKLAQWQGLQGAMDQLAQASGKATEAVKDIGRSIADIASERTRLQDQLDELTMTSAQMLDKQRSAIDDSNKSLFDQVQAQIALKDATTEAADAATKAADAAKAAAETYKQAAADRLSAVTGTASDAYAGLERAVAAQRAQEQAAYEAEKAIATAAFTSQSELYQKQIDKTKASLDAVGNSVGKLKSLSGSLKSTMDAMRITGSDSAYRAAAQAQIKAAVAQARSGGGLPLDGQLQSALSTVSKPSEDLFATFQDYARDFYTTANDISALTDLTDAQLSADEISQALLKDQVDVLENQKKLLKDGFKEQVSGLDAILANAKHQLDAANGINTSVLSVADALAALNVSVGQLAVTRASQGLATTPGVAESRADAIRVYITAQLGAGLTGTELANTIANRAKEVGTTEGEMARAIGWDASKVRAFFAGAGIPQFAVGTDYLPRDTLAMLHEGEQIVPKAYNPNAPGNSNSETAAALRALADRLDRIEANTRATAGHTAGTDRKLARVIPGNALITEVAV